MIVYAYGTGNKTNIAKKFAAVYKNFKMVTPFKEDLKHIPKKEYPDNTKYLVSNAASWNNVQNINKECTIEARNNQVALVKFVGEPFRKQTTIFYYIYQLEHLKEIKIKQIENGQ